MIKDPPRDHESGWREIRSSSSVRRRAWLRVAGTFAVLALLLAFLPRDQLLAAFQRLSFATWALAIAAYLSLHIVGALKWRLVLNAAEAGLGIRQAVRCYYAGLFGSVFLPSLVGGDVVRAGLAMGMARSRAGVILGSVVDRGLDLAALAAIAAVGGLAAPMALAPQSRRVLLALVLGLGAIGMIAVGLMAVLPARRLPFRVRRTVARFRRAFRATLRKPGRVVAAWALAVSLQVSLVLLNAWLGREVGILIPTYVWFFAWPIAKISALVPITQAGIGVREVALAGLLAPFGVPAALAVAVGFVFQSIVIGGGLVAGFVSWLLAKGRGSERTAG